MEREWLPIEAEDGNTGGPYALVRRIYGLNGAQYPRLSIVIYPEALRGSAKDKGIILTTSIKNDAEGWWYEYGIPLALLDDAIEMLLHCQDGSLYENSEFVKNKE
jgi:hypothetical protein